MNFWSNWFGKKDKKLTSNLEGNKDTKIDSKSQEPKSNKKFFDSLAD